MGVITAIFMVFGLFTHPLSALAQSNPLVSVESQCEGAGGIGERCTSNGNECDDNSIAKVCVTERGLTAGQCHVGCSVENQRDNSLCSLGEQCVLDEQGSGLFYCQPVPFYMTLNLLDQCITYWLEGGEPAWSENQCSLEANLNRLLDQNRDYQFDIFDLDLCVLAFLERPQASSALDCSTDEECGRGLFCDPETLSCTRECGLIPSREESISDLDYQCVGALKVCDYERGRCERLPLEFVEELTCEIDKECPSGAYCFLGQCAPYCYRGLDCPSSEWYCTDTNQCRVLPDPANEGQSFVFDPSLYAIRFGRKRLDLDAIRTRDEAPLAIMDLITRQQVISNPSVSFGYRLQLEYAIKEDLRCLAPFPENCDNGRDVNVDATAEDCYERRADCIIDPQTESWIRLTSPFGVVSAAGDPSIRVELEEEIASRLSPGTYRATLKAVYDNGDSDELQIYYNKKSPSGEYAGAYNVFYGRDNYSLSGVTPLNLAFKIHISDDNTSWDNLLNEEGIIPAIRDIATGKKVYAYLHGRDSVGFALPKVAGRDFCAPPLSRQNAQDHCPDVCPSGTTWNGQWTCEAGFTDGCETPTPCVCGCAEDASARNSDHEIPFLGVYYPDRGMMRLIGRSVVLADYFEGESSEDVDGMTAQNLFGRDIERQIELFGSFNENTGAFYGMYSEQITGMTPEEFTMRGSFNMKQRLSDASSPGEFHLLNLGLRTPAFPETDQLLEALEDQISLYCDSASIDHFSDIDSLRTYIDLAEEHCDPAASNVRTCRETIFPDLVTFSDLVGEALGSLGADAEGNYLTIYDFLRDRMQLCPEDTVCDSSSASPDSACADGYRCNRSRDLCVRRSVQDRIYEFNPRCNDTIACDETLNTFCDALNESCLTRSTTETCVNTSECAVGQICQQMEVGGDVRRCVRDLSNYSCVTIPDTAYITQLKSGTSAIPSEIQDLISRTQISYAELIDMVGESITVPHTLCVNTETPPEFQGYSAYEGGDSALCVSENNARCGLLLYQKALLNQVSENNPWIPRPNFAANIARLFGERVSTGAEGSESADPTLPLFCDSAIDITGCIPRANLDQSGDVTDVERARFVFQEHNRFWLHLMQAMKFQGDAYLSDAFVTLYRNQENPFTEGAAIVYKREQQGRALTKFNELLRIITSSPMAQVFFDWPIDAYLQRGNDWLKMMQTIASDRMDALATVVDLDRRVFMERDLSDKYDIIQNVMQTEYLFQAYLLKLQIDWQGGDDIIVGYEGRSEQIFREGQQILNQVNIDRNELGLFDNQVYFESTRTRDTELSNWHHYLNLLTGSDGRGGLLGEARGQVAEAVTEMKASLRDLDALEEKIFAARREISGYMAEQCGATASEMQASMSSASLGDINHDGRVDYCDFLLDKYTDDSLIKDIIDCKVDQGNDAQRNSACSRLSSVGADVGSNFTYSCEEDGFEGGTNAEEDYGMARDACQTVVSSFVSATNQILAEGGDQCAPAISGLSAAPNICPALCESRGKAWSGHWSCDRGYTGNCSGDTPCVCNCASTNDPLTAPPRCDLNRFNEYSVTLAGRKRLCVGGRMGALVQEKRLLEFQREQVIGSLETLLKRFGQKHGMGAELARKCLENEDDGEACDSNRQKLMISKKVLNGLQLVYEIYKLVTEKSIEVAKDAGDAIDCEFIAGLAVGTNCPMSVVDGVLTISVKVISYSLAGIAQSAFKLKDFAFEIAEDILSAKADQAELRHEMAEMIREVDNLITEFQTLTLQIFNANIEIHDLKYQIGANYATYQDDVRFIIDHLVGRETGNFLRGRRLAIESDEAFRKVLQYSYRMYMAFIHQYNINPADASGLKSRLINSTTLDDLERFIDELTQFEMEYCGREGIDCDTMNNVEVLRISLRDRLKPNLRDIVDPRTGRMVTAGEQFHNFITSPPYLQQVVLNEMPSEMIEFDFTSPLSMQEFGPEGPRWLINPLECNHLLTTGEDINDPHPGNIAVNIVGRNLGEGDRSIRYELARGGVDLLRSCHPSVTVEELGLPPVYEYGIRSFVVGYAPQSNEANLSKPRSFATRSGTLQSCLNSEERGGSLVSGSECWRFFARGRSLSAMDWKLRIPTLIDNANTESSWILGRGLPREERPIIEDIVIYLRYQSRPTSED